MTQETKAKWAARGLRAHAFVTSRPDWFLERLSNLNTTNFRVLFTMGFLWAPTCWRYVVAVDGWKPSVEWLSALLIMSGMDVAQWYGKRKTWKPKKGELANPGDADPDPGADTTTTAETPTGGPA